MSVFFRIFQHLLPRSRAWSLVTDKTLRRFFEGLAAGAAAPARAAVDSVWLELLPETTTELIEWEQQFGLWGSGTEAQRRAALSAAWSATGGQSPRYLQDTVQAAGFDLYIHGWRAPDDSVRNPHNHTTHPLLGTVQCDDDTAAQSQCGDAEAQCDRFLVGDPGYLVNELLNYEAPPPIPADPLTWRHFVYWGGETFDTPAVVPDSRLLELKRLLLKLCPAHLWIVLQTTSGTANDTFDYTFDATFG
jgi:uncharacterized protein YmfQ (DUF2313 family)